MAHANPHDRRPQLTEFDDVFRSEIDSINKRRARLRELGMAERADVALEDEAGGDGAPLVTSEGTTPKRPAQGADLVGLALSGGGIRSAAFCLGVLQALYKCGLVRKMDYLSTVSGGGYIGTSLTAGMTANGGHFPFASYLSEDETPSLQHVRDFSNYLFPRGALDALCNLAVYVRGLVANVILVLPFLLIAAVLTIYFHPLANAPSLADDFRATGLFAAVLLVVLIAWAILRSSRWFAQESEVPGGWACSIGLFIVLLLFVLFCQLQPFILDAMFAQGKLTSFQSLVAVVQKLIALLAPVAAVVAFIAQKFGEVIKSALESERLQTQLAGFAAKLTVYVAGAILPLLLWVIYLQFSYWGICSVGKGCAAPAMPHWLWSSANALTGLLPADAAAWMKGKAHLLLPGKRAVVYLYLVVALVCGLIIPFLRPNANSLHRLYRDRLSKAFLFVPRKTVSPAGGVVPTLAPLQMNLSGLSETDAPYQLINTALNVQASKAVNRRGRNADFFLLSRNFVGSRATGYVPTRDMEQVVTHFDLGAAVAVSGAAVSSNMGAATIKPLSATLALLNVRLGYWMRNPKRIRQRGGWSTRANFYFLAEMLGLLDERAREIYLSDGGHIDNLGLYELLRRRCQVIVIADAEADPQMAFGAFNIVERYALIDLGVRIDLPWQQITDVAKATGKDIDEKGDAPKKLGPHVAIGSIMYPGGRRGILVYIKSSLTGDENDYVFHYKKRYGAFPHETTLDQLFTEEQFEAYRALGFHAAHRFFDRRDDFAHLDPAVNPQVRDDMATLDALFPLAPADGSPWPRKHASFVGWLDEPQAAP